MRSVRAVPAVVGAVVLTAAATALAPSTAQAAVACNEGALVAAVNAANAAGGGNIALATNCTYTITAPHSNDGEGPNALPVITTAITLTGDTDTIARSSAPGAPAFRIAKVAAGGSLTLKGKVTLRNGNAATDGGGILNHGSVTLTASALTGNTAAGRGGALANADTAAPAAGPAATFTDSTVSGNGSTGQGGGVYNGLRGALTTTGSSVTNNSSGAQGGGIAAVDSAATTLTSTPVSANSATTAAGVYRRNGAMTLTTSPVSGNVPNNCVGSSPAVPGCVA
ncbi:Probable extracellular nuclease [Kitasatospora purpeofusca]